MRKILTILTTLLLLAAIPGRAQVIIPANGDATENIDPARLYLQRYKQGKTKKKAKAEQKDLDPLTRRRREMRAFVPQGNWFFGLALGYLTANTNHTDMEFSGMNQADMRLHGFALQPYVGYALGNNSIIGLRGGYSETHGKKPFYPRYEGETLLHTFRNLDYTHQIYNLEALWRAYVPIDSRLRWAFFTDLTLGYQGGNGHLLTDRDDTPYRANFSLNQIRLGLRPGIALALTNNVSMDFSIGLANANYSLQHEKNRDGESIRTNEFRINSLLDIANFQCGISVNY